MRHGIVLFTSDRGITPAALAKAAEDRGFSTFYVPEHTHIPVRRDALHPTGGEDLPDDRYLRTLADHLPFARLFLVEAHAAGPEALARRAAVQDRLVDALVAATGARRAADRFACRAYVAAVASLVALPVATGDTDALAGLRRPLLTHLDELFARVRAGRDR